MLNKLKYRVKQLAYGLLPLVKNPFAAKRLLVIRLDGIGDYILFRNAITPIKQSVRFKQHRFTLLGNRAFKDLATAYDSDSFEEFIWVDPQLIYNIEFFNWTTFRFLLSLKLKGFEVVIYPTHSRLPQTDLFIKYLDPGVAIASEGDSINYTHNEKQKGDAVYDELISVPSYHSFEFYRNRIFTQNLIGDPQMDLALSLNDLHAKVSAEEQVIIIFPGAGLAYRRWSTHHFARLMGLIAEADPRILFYIAGGKTDTVLAQEIIQLAPDCNIRDYTGKTSLPEMAELLTTASLLISNETSSVHLAAAVHLATICISNGNQFGRFNPYPLSLRDNIETVYPSEAFLDNDRREQLIEQYKIQSGIDINSITPEKVFSAVCKLLPLNNPQNRIFVP